MATRRRTIPAAGLNDVLWAEFTAAHPVEAALVDGRGGADIYLHEAYAAVATYARRDSNRSLAFRCLARHQDQL